jgi:hypothetical protein
MTAARDDGAARYFVVQRKGALFPTIAAVAYQLVHSPVWSGLCPVDPAPLLAVLVDAAVQAAFFSDHELNATLKRTRRRRAPARGRRAGDSNPQPAELRWRGRRTGPRRGRGRAPRTRPGDYRVR